MRVAQAPSNSLLSTTYFPPTTFHPGLSRGSFQLTARGGRREGADGQTQYQTQLLFVTPANGFRSCTCMGMGMCTACARAVHVYCMCMGMCMGMCHCICMGTACATARALHGHCTGTARRFRTTAAAVPCNLLCQSPATPKRSPRHLPAISRDLQAISLRSPGGRSSWRSCAISSNLSTSSWWWTARGREGGR